MGIKVRKERTFKRTVKARLQSPDVIDAFEDVSFVGVYRALSRTKIEALNEKDDSITESARVTKFVREIMVGAEGFVDEDDAPIGSVDALAVILDDITLCQSAINTFNESYYPAKEKN